MRAKFFVAFLILAVLLISETYFSEIQSRKTDSPTHEKTEEIYFKFAKRFDLGRIVVVPTDDPEREIEMSISLGILDDEQNRKEFLISQRKQEITQVIIDRFKKIRITSLEKDSDGIGYLREDIRSDINLRYKNLTKDDSLVLKVFIPVFKFNQRKK